MTRPTGWRRYVPILRSDPDADVEAELQFHLEMRARELEALGMPREAALDEARRRFGDMERVRAECRRLERTKERRAARLRTVGDFGRDVGFAVRSLVKQPVFTIAAVLTLGLGIGVNAAIFSAVNAYLIKPLPVRDPERLVFVASTIEGDDLVSQVSIPNFNDLAALDRVFESAVAFSGDDVAYGTGEAAVRSFALVTTGNYFDMLGVRPALGRMFTTEEARAREPVIVLSDAFWKRKYDRDPGVIGKTEQLNGVPFQIIGIAPPEFTGTQPLVAPDYIVSTEAKTLFAPDFAASLVDRSAMNYRMMARLRPGVTVEQARAQLKALGAELQQRYPNSNRGMQFTAEYELRTRPDFAIAHIMPWVAAIFLGLVGLALLVACANVTNLLLSRAAARSGEIAVRSAMGATPGRLVRLLLAESLAISLAALAIAVFFARGAIGWLNSRPIQVDVPVHFGIVLDWRVFAYSAAIALTAGVIAGIAPAMLGTRVAVGETLKQGGRSGSAGRGRSRLRSSLVVAQMAVSFILLVSASLFTRSMQAAMKSDLGFRRENLLLATTNLRLHSLDSVQARRFQDAFLQEVRAIPGVREAALAGNVPFSGNFASRDYYIDERPASVPDGHLNTGFERASPGWLSSLGIKLLAGRDFTDRDDENAPPVALVNRELADRFWPGSDPIGRRVRFDSSGGPEVTVIGVVANMQIVFLNEAPRPQLTVPLRQQPAPQTTLIVRTEGDPSSFTPMLRAAAERIDPKVLLYGVRTMENHLTYGIAFFFVRIAATLATFIGLLALMQTIVGLYGVLSYSVMQRRKEFGIRLALGAQPAAVTRGVLRQGSIMALIGIGVGGTIAVVLSRAMRGFLVGVSPTDALAFFGSAVVVAGAAALSSYLPARRASQVAPGSALRAD